MITLILVALLASLMTTNPAPPPTRQPIPSLNGTWVSFVADKGTGRLYRSTLHIVQRGTTISGIGTEHNIQFAIRGLYDFPRIRFEKSFIDADFQPVTFEGRITSQTPMKGNSRPIGTHMSGDWWLTGGFLRWNIDNTWIADLKQAGPSEPTDNDWHGVLVDPTRKPEITHLPLWKILLGVPQVPKPADWAQAFLRIAGFLMLCGIGLVYLSARMFGPSGVININAKKEYIPSQFRKDHGRVLKTFGQPVVAGGVPLGTRADWSIFRFWQPKTLAMPPEVRNKNPHMLVIGSSSKGKTRLLASMIAQDIESNDRAVVVIDSDGGLVDLVVSWIASRESSHDLANRVIIVDPTSSANAPSFNPLQWPEDASLQNAAAAVVFGFKAIYTEPPGSQTQWNAQTADILRNSAILLIANGKTLADLPTLLSENDFRDQLLEAIERRKNDRPEYVPLLEAWARYKRMARTEQWINWIEPILNRVNPMLGDPRMRRILVEQIGTLDLASVISERKILLVKLPEGQLDQNGRLLGGLLVTGLKRAALMCSQKTTHHQTALFLDEFDNLIEQETFNSLTADTKNFGIGVVACTKTLQGLPEDYRNRLVINIGTLCCFAIGRKDGDLLGPQLFRVDGRKIKQQTLQNIFNRVNTMPQMELISDEEKLNVDRVVGQEDRTYFCYQVGSIAGVFMLKTPDFCDPAGHTVNWNLVTRLNANQHSSKAQRLPASLDNDKTAKYHPEDTSN